MLFYRRHKNILQSIAVGLCCLLVFGIFWYLSGRNAKDKAQSALWVDSHDASTQTLKTEAVQQFTFEGELYGVGLVPVYEGVALPGTFYATLSGPSGEVMYTVEGNAAHTESGAWAVFSFPEAVRAEDGAYTLTFTAQMQDDVPVSLMRANAAPEGWFLAVNGEAEEGALCTLAVTGKIGSFATRLYWGFAAAVSLFLGALCFIVKRKTMALHKVFALAASVLGLLYCLVLPPYSAPDEQFHINQSFNISSRMMGKAPADIQWGENYKRASDHDVVVENQNTTIFTYRHLAKNMFTTAADSTTTVYNSAEVGGYLLLYLPASLVVTLCRLVGLGFVPTLFLGRLANMALYIVLASLAVKIAPCCKSVFMGVGLLPMGLHLAASFSRDGPTIALWMLQSALCLQYILEKDRIDAKEIAILALVCLAAAPAKIVYAPLLMLVLMIPRYKFHWRGKKMKNKAAIAVRLGIVALSAVFLLWQDGASMLAYSATKTSQEANYYGESAAGAVAATQGGTAAFAIGAAQAPQASTGFAPLALAAEDSGATPAPDNTSAAQDSFTFTLKDVFTRPATVLTLILRTVFYHFTDTLRAMLGGLLGYNDLPLNWIFVIALCLLLGAASLPNPREPRFSRPQRFWAGIWVLCGCLAILVGSITWTPTYYETIYGIQGRYFLPLLPMALVVFSRNWGGIKRTRDISLPLTFAFSIVSSFALFNALLVVFSR